jgi:hypothetical protein
VKRTNEVEEKRMKTLMALAAFGIACSGAAFAQTMANSYENTVVLTYANGAQAHYHFNADNTFGVHAPDGSRVHGRYEVTGDQICLTPEGGERACTQYVDGKNVGDTWTQPLADGSTATATIVAGREGHDGEHGHGH